MKMFWRLLIVAPGRILSTAGTFATVPMRKFAFAVFVPSEPEIFNTPPAMVTAPVLVFAPERVHVLEPLLRMERVFRPFVIAPVTVLPVLVPPSARTFATLFKPIVTLPSERFAVVGLKVSVEFAVPEVSDTFGIVTDAVPLV